MPSSNSHQDLVICGALGSAPLPMISIAASP
jgi:hypothetical protein